MLVRFWQTLFDIESSVQLKMTRFPLLSFSFLGWAHRFFYRSLITSFRWLRSEEHLIWIMHRFLVYFAEAMGRSKSAWFVLGFSTFVCFPKVERATENSNLCEKLFEP